MYHTTPLPSTITSKKTPPNKKKWQNPPKPNTPRFVHSPSSNPRKLTPPRPNPAAKQLEQNSMWRKTKSLIFAEPAESGTALLHNGSSPHVGEIGNYTKEGVGKGRKSGARARARHAHLRRRPPVRVGGLMQETSRGVDTWNPRNSQSSARLKRRKASSGGGTCFFPTSRGARDLATAKFPRHPKGAGKMYGMLKLSSVLAKNCPSTTLVRARFPVT